MNWSTKKAIAFDLGYTLVTNNRVQLHQQFLRNQGIELEEEIIRRAYHLADKKFMRAYPKVISTGWDYYFPWFVGKVNFLLGHQFNLIEQTNFMKQEIDRLWQSGQSFWTPFPWTVDTLQKLREQNFRLALLSNWDASARPILSFLELDELFDVIIISDEFGCEKPDPSIFQELLLQLNCSSEEVVYVGDNYYDDVPGAAEVGIATLLLNPYGRLGMEELNYTPVVPDIRHLLELLPLHSHAAYE